VLAAHQNYKKPETWTSEVLATVDSAARGISAETGKSGPKPRTAREAPDAEGRRADPLPHRGVGVQPDGSVSMALYTRYVAGVGRTYAAPALESGSRWMWN